MKIAPIDIAHKTFARKVMGLDGDEVSDFLRDVADQMEEIIRERNALKEQMRQKEMQILEYRERDDSLKATITTATKMSEQIRMDSEREAKLIVNDAQQKAEMITKDSRDSLKRIYQEISDLKRTRMQFEANLRSVCGAHLSMLDQSHLMLPDPQINLAQAQASLNPGQPMNTSYVQNAGQNINQNSNQATNSGMPTLGYPQVPGHSNLNASKSGHSPNLSPNLSIDQGTYGNAAGAQYGYGQPAPTNFGPGSGNVDSSGISRRAAPAVGKA